MTEERKIKVLLDTNALLMPFQFRLNIDDGLSRLLGECDVYVISSVTRELENLVAENAGHAKAALTLSRRYRRLKTSGPADEALVSKARELSAVVVTNDAKLRRRLKQNGIRVLFLRERTHLAEG